jgi:F-type H+-transporting ATPase subunit b
MSEQSKARRRVGAPAVRWGSFVTTVIGMSLIFAGPLLAQEHGDGGGGGGVDIFAINPGLIVWTWAIFVILLIVLRKWAWGPILGALEAREKRIQDALDDASRERVEASKLLNEQRKLLDESRGQAQQIIVDGRKAGERLKGDIVDEARKQAGLIVENAREDIERERDNALETLRREAVDLSISAAGRVLDKEVDSNENRRLVEDYLEGLAAESGGGRD